MGRGKFPRVLVLNKKKKKNTGKYFLLVKGKLGFPND